MTIDEWVELYNPTSQDISLASYRLKRKIASGVENNLVANFAGASIKAKGYFLISNPTSYRGRVIPDATTTASYVITNDNLISLYDGSLVVDKLGFGTATNSEASTTDNLQASQAAVRKASINSTAITLQSSEKYAGHNRDTDNNREDFVIINSYQPHSSEIGDQTDLPDQVSLGSSEFSTSSVSLKWSAPDKAVRYDIRYQVNTGVCNLNYAWRTASSATANLLAGAVGAQEAYVLNGLLPGINYCVAIRTFNGKDWSVLSNQLEVRTACADILPHYDNYTVKYGRASTSTTPNTPAEYVMSIYIIRLAGANGNYYIAPNKTCAWNYGGAAVYLSEWAVDRLMIEVVYDPASHKFTGKYRYCDNGAWYINLIGGDGRCVDMATWWYGARWANNPALVGEDTIMISDNNSGSHTNWLKLDPQ